MHQLTSQPIRIRTRIRVGARDQPILEPPREEPRRGEVHPNTPRRAGATPRPINQGQLQPPRFPHLLGDARRGIDAGVDDDDRLERLARNSLGRQCRQTCGDVLFLVASRNDNDRR